MPNYITNIVQAPKHVIDALLNDNNEVDFNRVIQTPDDIIQDPITLGVDYHGKDWYSWNTSNWGTKWNASGTKLGENTVIFETAWSHPAPIFKELSRMFSSDTFYIAYADEDFGYNLGIIKAENGQLTYYDKLIYGDVFSNVLATAITGYYNSYVDYIQEIISDYSDDDTEVVKYKKDLAEYQELINNGLNVDNLLLLSQYFD